MIKVHILCGLPGSGKTTFARSLSGNPKIKVIDVDEIVKGKENKMAFFLSKLNGLLEELDCEEAVLDGLFLDKKVYEVILKELSPDVEVVFHYWERNRKLCLYNDEGRRNVNSSITIRSARFQEPDIEKLKILNKNISLESHVIKKKGEPMTLEEFKQKYNKGEEYIYSEHWCAGGENIDCWGEVFKVDKEDPPEEWAFDEIISNIKEEISGEQYEKIKSYCVWIEENSESDYYGGIVENHHYMCSLNVLFETLQEEDITIF